MTSFYNENDPFCCDWLLNLQMADEIAGGLIDSRCVKELTPDDLTGVTQAHFFAGIGIWSHALRLAGWPDDVPVWTGSCPCQPFSVAGRRKGNSDDRHLWPTWHGLIEECQPAIVFGEQVARADGLDWFDAVRSDLERAGYAVGGADLCAAGLGAPHVRQRIFFVAVTNGKRRQRLDPLLRIRRPQQDLPETARRAAPGRVGHGGGGGSRRHAGKIFRAQENGAGRGEIPRRISHQFVPAGTTGGYWREADWLYCFDETRRPVEPGTLPLADGDSSRVACVRAYGNAIVAPVAATFIRAVMELL